MGKHAKAIGSIVGGVVTLAASFGLPTGWVTPEVQNIMVILGGAIVAAMVKDGSASDESR
jgi:hypothetical protein